MDNVEKRVALAMLRAEGRVLTDPDLEQCIAKQNYAHLAQAALQSIGYERMREALERLSANFDLLLAGKPVRDVAETRAEVRAALKGDSDRAALNRGEVG